jgi:hypothetical protein
MTKVAVVEIEGCMASSAAITHDVMATANRISAAKRAPPFKVTTVRCGSRRSNVDLRGIELVIPWTRCRGHGNEQIIDKSSVKNPDFRLD